MTLIKKGLSAVIVALAISLASFMAQAEEKKKVLDVIVASTNTGLNWTQGVMLHKALIERGYDSELVHTQNCFKNKKYIESVTRPSFWFKSSSSWVSDIQKGCIISPTEESFITPYFYRSFGMGVRKSDNVGDTPKEIMEWIKSKDRVTVGTFNNLPDDFAQLGEQFGNTWKKVPYNGSANTLRGFLAGDTDLLYLGYTTREINTPDLYVFATNDGLNGTAELGDLFPNWDLRGLYEFPYVHGVAMNAEQKADARRVIQDMLTNDPDLSKYYASAFIPTSVELEKRGLDLDAWWDDVARWYPGGATPEQLAAWKQGKLK